MPIVPRVSQSFAGCGLFGYGYQTNTHHIFLDHLTSPAKPLAFGYPTNLYQNRSLALALFLNMVFAFGALTAI